MNREEMTQASMSAADYLRTVRRLYELSDTEQGGERMLAAINAFALCEMALCLDQMTTCMAAIWSNLESKSRDQWVKLADVQQQRKEGQHGV